MRFKQSAYIILSMCVIIGLLIAFTFMLTGCRRPNSPRRPPTQITQPPTQTPALTPEQKAVQKITTQSQAIQSLYADMEIVLRKRTVPLMGNGYFCYEQSHKFRLINKGIRNGQLNSDVGGNEQEFWFYIRRLHSDTMYTCDWSRQSQSSLPDSINPLFLLEILNLDLDYSKSKARIEGNLLVTTETLPGGSEKATVIDLKRPAVVSMHLRKNGQVISRTQVLAFVNLNGIFIPSKIQAEWYEENMKIEWRLSNHRINTAISSNQFQTPNLNLKTVDIGRATVDFSKER